LRCVWCCGSSSSSWSSSSSSSMSLSSASSSSSLSLSTSVSLSVCLSVCVCLSTCLCLFVRLCVCVSVCLPAWLPACLSVFCWYLFVCLYVQVHAHEVTFRGCCGCHIPTTMPWMVHSQDDAVDVTFPR
jgi:hypothetical protein